MVYACVRLVTERPYTQLVHIGKVTLCKEDIRMTINTVTKDARMSKIGRKPRPVEDQVVDRENARETVLQEQPDEKRTQLHQTTRTLGKALFRCTCQEDVNKVVESANKCNISFFEMWGENPRFELRIRHLEGQIREMLDRKIDFSSIDPCKVAVRVHTIQSVAIVDSWGHLVDKALKGYKLSILK